MMVLVVVEDNVVVDFFAFGGRPRASDTFLAPMSQSHQESMADVHDHILEFVRIHTVCVQREIIICRHAHA